MKNQVTHACRAHVFLRGAALAACLAVVVGSALPVVACNDEPRCGPKPLFSAIYVFGDSLSDTWRAAEILDQTPPPGLAWLNGRLCNGPLWVEYLAPALGLKYNPDDNFSWAGALTGEGNRLDPTGILGLGGTGMLGQLNQFLAALDPEVGADPDALYLVFGGGNDFFKILGNPAAAEQTAAQVVENIVTIIARLRLAGAQHIVLMDLPDLGIIPGIQAIDTTAPGTAAAVSGLCATVNAVLVETLDSYGLEVIHARIFDLTTDWMLHPRKYGLTNITDTSIPDLGLARHYLFWDKIHPTSRGQASMAMTVMEALNEADLVQHGRRLGHWGRSPFACGAPRP